MVPTMILDLANEPTCLIWNGEPVTLSGKYTLLPDNKVKHLHRRVLAVAHNDNVQIPFYGRVVGAAKFHTETIWLIENEETGRLERTRKPQVIGEETIMRCPDIKNYDCEEDYQEAWAKFRKWEAIEEERREWNERVRKDSKVAVDRN